MPPLTYDERLVLSTMIALHGFQLYRPPRNHNRRILIGRSLGQDPVSGQVTHEMIAKWATGQVSPHRARTGFSVRWKLLDWDVLSDDDLVAFHHTVVSTC